MGTILIVLLSSVRHAIQQYVNLVRLLLIIAPNAHLPIFMIIMLLNAHRTAHLAHTLTICTYNAKLAGSHVSLAMPLAAYNVIVFTNFIMTIATQIVQSVTFLL